MIRMTLEQAGEILGVRPESQLVFTGVTTDSRQVQPGMLFAALPGERVDGHDFIARAEEAGAIAVLVQRPVDARVPQLRVSSVLHALGELAAAWRATLPVRVAAMTGSNGKTTTKEMLTSILSLSGEVLATAGNYNNELGVPLTLFGLSAKHDFAVIEMGCGKPGDIRYLAGLAKPEAGAVTNVGPAHLQGLRDEEGVARTKGELYAALPAGGCAIFNIEEPWLAMWEGLSTARNAQTFGFHEAADIRAVKSKDGWNIRTLHGDFALTLRLPGKHNVMNAMAATGLALALDIGLEQIREGLAMTTAVPGRLNLLDSAGGWRLIDDTYNANPASMRAAANVLMSQPGRPWAALSDMRELGDASDQFHAETGVMLRELGVERLFATGRRSRAMVAAFGQGAEHFDNRDALISALQAAIDKDVVCLVKGSRSMQMEHVVDALAGSSSDASYGVSNGEAA